MNGINDFFQKYYVEPILTGSGYNIVNTITYAAILIIAALLTYKLLKALKVSIDRKFLVGILPYIALGGILRSIEDFGESLLLEKNFFLITPLIYFTIFAIALAALLISILIQKKFNKSYHITWFAIGVGVALAALAAMKLTNFYGMALMLGIFIGWVIVFIAVKKIAEKKNISSINNFLTWENILVLLIHLFDATTTFVSIQFFPYYEQHVLPSFLIGIAGPIVMFPLKLAVVGATLYVFDKELKNEEQKRTFLKIIVMVVGMGPGIRNFLRLAMGV